MQIKLSRYAQRRMQLYNIDTEDVINTIKEQIANQGSASGKRQIINQGLTNKYRYPLKVIISVEGTGIVVITAYPLRKGRG